MPYLQNLHTHTVFCDGRDTPEEMVRAALAQGLDSIGFSGHSNTPFDHSYCMTTEQTAQYRREIERLKEAYAGRIDVLCGLERDLFSDAAPDEWDYIIGSVHYLRWGNRYIDFDLDTASVRTIVAEEFGGDGLAFARAYYETVCGLAEQERVDIVGHFDILTKTCEQTPGLIPWESDAYRKLALEALHTVAARHPVFEINTGAIARGYRTTPYPAPFLLKELRALGGQIVLTADCHNSRFLLTHRQVACELAKSCGFHEMLVLREGRFQPIALT